MTGFPKDTSDGGIPSEFFDLLRRWSEARKKQHRGGSTALSGFDYQLNVALVELVRNYDRRQPYDLFFEALSDIVGHHRGKLIVTQTKLTLTGSKLHSALDELWSIELLAHEHAPGLIDRLTYVICVNRIEPRNWTLAKERWNPPTAQSVQRIKDFRGRLSFEILRDPAMELAQLLADKFKDPYPVETATSLVGDLMAAARDGNFAGAIERIVSRLRGKSTSALELTRKFYLWGRDDRPPENVELETDPRRATRAGQRLSIADLREGRLASRKIYLKAHGTLFDWLRSTDNATGKLPVFWIEGRSGSGKSAALLHVLAQLHHADPSRAIVWLGERSELIGEALSWSREFLKGERELVIAVDDPFVADRQSAFKLAIARAQDEWDSVRNSGPDFDGGAVRPPFIVCCGPTEQREAASRSCVSDIEVTPHPLGGETAEDLDELAEWFKRRTGKDAPAINGDVLLVQRFFEWTNGDITEFAHRFRQRLEAFDVGRGTFHVFDMVAQILALGRLYADYPAPTLAHARSEDPHLDAAFIQLANDSHFAFGPNEQGATPSGIRFTHPHLADAIYKAWFGGPSYRGYRRLHLKRALTAALEQTHAPPNQRLGPLRAIAQIATMPQSAIPSASDMHSRLKLIEHELKEILPGLYSTFGRQEVSSLIDLPVWIDLDCALALKMAPPPLQRLADQLATTAVPGTPGLAGALTKLMQFGDGDTKMESILVDAMNRFGDWRDEQGSAWAAWPSVAKEMTVMGKGAPILAPLEGLAIEFPTWPSLVQVMLQLANGLDRQPEGRPVLLKWLAYAPSTVWAWAPVLNAVRRKSGRCPEYDRLAMRLVTQQLEHRAWPVVWSRLMDDGVVDIQPLASLGARWIQTVDFEDRRWPHIWGRLWKLADSALPRSELEQLGHRWLDFDDLDQSGWPRVWEPLWTATEDLSPKRNELWIKAEQLLTERWAHPGWHVVWRTIWRDSPRKQKRLLELADEWLRDAGGVVDGHLGWPFVWQHCWESALVNAEARSDLNTLGLTWIKWRQTDKHWHLVWLRLWAAHQENEPMRNDLLDAAISWLDEVDVDHVGQNWILQQLHEAEIQDANTQYMLKQLAEKQGARLAAPFAWATKDDWQERWNRAADDERLRDALFSEAVQWLQAWLQKLDTSQRGWSSIWVQLWDSAALEMRDDLSRLADEWLTVVGASHPKWTLVWRYLWNYHQGSRPHRSSLFDKAVRWLDEAKRGNDWRQVRETLDTFSEADSSQQVALDRFR